MNKFRLSTDILSPLQSDASLNDTSIFAYGSISGTPEFEREIKSPEYEAASKDSNIDSFCKRTMKESAAAFDVIVNDIKKQSNINAAKEERFKESYEMLKHSMDELYDKISYPSVLSPISNESDLKKSVSQTENTPAEEKMYKISEAPQNLIKDSRKKPSTKSKTNSHISSRKSKKREESEVSNKRKEINQQSKTMCPLKESIDKGKHSKNKSYLENEKEAKGSQSECGFQNLKTSKTSSTQTCEDFQAVGATGKENLKNYYSQKQRKAVVSNSLPAVETKNVSIEKSIQIAISMEMDNLRRFVLEQNLGFRKDLLKLQETAKKQGEVTGYLFSVIEELMKENKKLFSKNN